MTKSFDPARYALAVVILAAGFYLISQYLYWRIALLAYVLSAAIMTCVAVLAVVRAAAPRAREPPAS